MVGTSARSEIERLRRQAEAALRRSRGRKEVLKILERIVELAAEESDAALFAHRHLAEVLIEEHPWRAALHLRKVLAATRHDDVVHALTGLCQALLGNFRCAVGAYRRALSIAPRNPWYHHNLGHLLDVAIGSPWEAVEHLRAAHDMEPEEHEITASLAHCLARVGELSEARSLADEAVRSSPRNRDHRALSRWIEAGALEDEGPRMSSTQKGRRTSEDRPRRPVPEARGRDVVRAFERGMREAGFSARQVERAKALWSDFRDGRSVRVNKPEVYAAAVEYAIALVHGLHGVTQASIARRYGIAPTTLSTRYGEIKQALSLRPGDPRYGSSQ